MNDLDGFMCIILIVAALIFGVFIGCIIDNGPKFCPECGRRYVTKTVYCSHCGVELLERRTGN